MGQEERPHGFCVACVVNCHDGHEIHELYNKIDFRCDCGNGRMANCCQLLNDKEYENEQNRYNNTFLNKYCRCQKPFEGCESEEEFMIEC